MSKFTDGLSDSEKEIVRYLLGDVTESECDAIGEKSVVDDDYAEQVAMTKCDLMEAYVQGALSEDEKAAFDKNFPMTRYSARLMAMLTLIENAKSKKGAE